MSPDWPGSSYFSSKDFGPPPMDPDGMWTSVGKGTADIVELAVDVEMSIKKWMYLD